MTFEKFACHLCSKENDTRGKLNKHLKTHTKPYNCQTCTRGFASHLDLQRHIKSQHRAGNEKYRCHIEGCHFTSNRKDNRRRHQKQKHSAMLFGYPDENNEAARLPDEQSNVLGTTQLYNVSNFMRVAASGDLDRLETFLDAGLNIEARAEDQSTVLHCAAKAGQAAAVIHLLTKGASVEAWNDKNRLPIHEAILSNSPETLECFLERMTQASLLASKKGVERHLVRSGNADMVDAYITRLGSDYTNRNVSKKLSFAIRTGHYSLVTALLDDSNVDGNGTIHGHSLNFAPIHLAAMLGQIKVMESLVTCDRINVDLKDNLLRQPLHIAALKGHTAIVELLISHPSADVNCRDKDGATPLHYASENGHIMIAEQLLRHPSVDVNCRDRYEATTLHHAVSNGHWETASFLLRHSDSMSDGYRISSDVSPISLTFTKEDILHRLLKHPDFGGPNKLLPDTHKTILHIAAERGDCEVIALLLDYPDIDVNVPQRYGGTALATAAKNGKLESVKLLLQHKDTNVNYKKHDGEWTALQYAKAYKHNEIADLLLSHGAIDHDAKAPTTVPTTTQIDNPQNTTLQPDHEAHFDPFDDDMDDAAIEPWDELFGMEEGMDE